MASIRNFACPKLEDELLYFTKKKDRFWIKGQVAKDNPHVTLLYGLMPGVKKKHVDAVLKGWTKKTIMIDGISYFDSPYKDDPYYCIVGEVNPYGDGDLHTLEEANERLKLLPHVNTFPGYKAHITLAYVKKDQAVLQKAIEQFDKALVGKRLRVAGLDYGKSIGE